MSNRGPISARRRRNTEVADTPAVDAPVAATESRFAKVKNAVVNHPFIAGGVAVTAGLIGFDAIANAAKIGSFGEFAYGSLCVAALVATVEAAGYGAVKLAKAAYNNSNLESAKAAGKTALTYAAKPFTFGFDMLKAGYNKLPSFSSKKAADATSAATPAAREEARQEVQTPAPRRSSRLKNK